MDHERQEGPDAPVDVAIISSPSPSTLKYFSNDAFSIFDILSIPENQKTSSGVKYLTSVCFSTRRRAGLCGFAFIFNTLLADGRAGKRASKQAN